MDINTFRTLGFTPNETRLYLALIDAGTSTAQALAKKLKIPRSTVYSVLDGLHARNLVNKQRKQSSTFFRVENPAALLDVVSRRENEIEQQKETTKQLITELHQLYRGSLPLAPRMEYVEGKTKVEKFLESYITTWSQSMLKLKTTTFGFQDHTFPQIYGALIKKLWKVIHEQYGIQGKILSNSSPVESRLVGKVPNREVRFLGPEFDFQSSFWVMGDYVVLIQTRNEPTYASQFHDPLLAANLRLVFGFLYNQAKAIK